MSWKFYLFLKINHTFITFDIISGLIACLVTKSNGETYLQTFCFENCREFHRNIRTRVCFELINNLVFLKNHILVISTPKTTRIFIWFTEPVLLQFHGLYSFVIFLISFNSMLLYKNHFDIFIERVNKSSICIFIMYYSPKWKVSELLENKQIF